MRFKRQHEDAILFFRMGDFYEMFFDDAKQASRLLGLTLTSRNHGKTSGAVPLAGIPHHQLETYVARLLLARRKVAICEQVEDPKKAKGIVKRDVVQVVTPGTALADSMLDRQRNNYTAGLFPDGDAVGVALVDLSTGVFTLDEVPGTQLRDELARAGPAELLVSEAVDASWLDAARSAVPDIAVSRVEDWHFELDQARQTLLDQLDVQSLKAFDCEDAVLAIRAGGAVIQYLRDNQRGALDHIRRLSRRRREDYLFLDAAAQSHLDLLVNQQQGTRDGSLLDVVDHTCTPMGARLLRQWMTAPLRDPQAIGERLQAVESLVAGTRDRARLRELLQQIGDLERMMARICCRRGNARDLIGLATSLGVIPSVAEVARALGESSESAPAQDSPRAPSGAGTTGEKASAFSTAAHGSPQDLPGSHPAPSGAGTTGEKASAFSTAAHGSPQDLPGSHPAPLLATLAGAELPPSSDLVELIRRALVDDPPATITEGGMIREGYCDELDELRQVATGGRGWIADLQVQERERTGITSLKVGYNQVFGYYIEVTKPNLERVPDNYTRRQTLTNAERFVTPELKDWEARVLGAEERMGTMENGLFLELRDRAAGWASQVQQAAHSLARLDVLASLAEVAAIEGYVRPVIDDSHTIDIVGGRHPVVERQLQQGRFVPNDLHTDAWDDQLLLITGPNMAGKSTIVRQAGLIVLLAQMGGFVPARRARIGVVDRIFTRVGASDNLARGESTFMVEMIEAAGILNNASDRSLILMDELGRGTSTFDGLSIAWSIVEYLHDGQGPHPRTLFATHYHELTELAKRLARVRNYNVQVREEGNRVVFLHRLAPGPCDRSYGIHVAQMAGMPAPVVTRAEEILCQLEKDQIDARGLLDLEQTGGRRRQLDLFGATPPPSHLQALADELAGLDLSNMTPLEALLKLSEWQKENT